jgi:hypothetical protein
VTIHSKYRLKLGTRACFAPHTRFLLADGNNVAAANNLFTQPKFARLLNVRGLSVETLRLYQVGACVHKFPNPSKANAFEEQLCITMPWMKTRAQEQEIKAQMEPDAVKAKVAAEKERERTRKKTAKDKDKTVATKNNAPISIHVQASTTASSSTPASSSNPSSAPFPTPSSADQVTERIKLRSLVHKGNQRLLPSGGVWSFFGWETVPAESEELVITEGEFDAMAVFQGLPAVSLPNGAKNLPVELLPLLEKFKRIYLWLDDDAAGTEGADKFARKLGVGRCLIVKSSLPSRREEHEVRHTDAIGIASSSRSCMLTLSCAPFVVSFSTGGLRRSSRVVREAS